MMTLGVPFFLMTGWIVVQVIVNEELGWERESESGLKS